MQTMMMSVVWISTMLSVASASRFPALDHIRPSASMADQQQAAQDLIARVLGVQQASHFKAVLIENKDQELTDTYNIKSNGTMVTVSGTSGVAIAMGFYDFLKTSCHCQYTWAGQQLKLPELFPVIPEPGTTVTTNDRFRYYQNVCTVSYTFAFWNWTQWERHIDWMAMNGINLPLAFNGQEAIFKRVYMNMGITVEELDGFFGGPAFLAWSLVRDLKYASTAEIITFHKMLSLSGWSMKGSRMGNIQGWGGPLPQSWIDSQLALQHMILDRMRSLGMIPILPAFAGHVPGAITRLFPNASVSRLGDWGNFNSTYCCTYLLDFHDPLFQDIGSTFIQEMQTEFGVDHIYNADSFNEMNPASSDPAYLKSAGSAVYRAMTSADADAVWLMQGWLFYASSDFWKPPQVEALLTSVPQGRMIVLDLFAEVHPVYTYTQSFYGQPFIWCMLHNFGGTMELYGVIETVNQGPFDARSFPGNTMIGIGLTPEGILQNEAMYELMNENAVAKSPRNLTQWFTNFTINRYGQYDVGTDQAWQLLKMSVYNNTDKMADHSGQVIITSRPSLKPLQPDVWYNPELLFKAWEYLVQASSTFADNELFRYDLVDVTRNSLQVLSLKFYTEILTAYMSKDILMLQTAANDLLDLFADLDLVLGSDKHFLLGRWLWDAVNNSTAPSLMEYNARNQLTLWGPNGEILDYAAKQWSGLISGYYAPRWKLFLDTLVDCLKTDQPFNQGSYDTAVFENIEKPFTFDTSPYAVDPAGYSVEIAADLFNKYLPVTQSKFYNLLYLVNHNDKLSNKMLQIFINNNWKSDRTQISVNILKK